MIGVQSTSMSRGRALAGVSLCAAAAVLFGGCQLEHFEKAAPGQPTMNELMHRRADRNQQDQKRNSALMARAQALTPGEAESLLADLKKKAGDADTYGTLVRYFEYKQNVKDRDAMRLWLIEHQPAGTLWPGNIDPRVNPAGYEKGKRLWLANLKRPGMSAEAYARAADFLDGGDRPLAEQALQAGRTAHPNDSRWPVAFGMHYAQALLGSAAPLTDFNVIRAVSVEEARSSYAHRVRASLAESTDAAMLAQTAQWLVVWGNRSGEETIQLARAYLERALSINPNSLMANGVKENLLGFENRGRIERLLKLSPTEQKSIGDSDRMLLTLTEMRMDWVRQMSEHAAAKARSLVDLAARNKDDALFGEALFGANMLLGKVALRHGDRKAAVRDLMAAADTAVSGQIRTGAVEMNLPRALVDRGERSAVAEFLNRMAPKMNRPNQFRNWAAEILKGINPDLTPTFSYPGCSHDPC